MPDNIVRLREVDGIIYASSRHVAEDFRKQHGHVLRDIAAIREETPPYLEALWFRDDCYFDIKNERRPCIDMTRQGWELVVMNYRGLLPWKVAYILKFEEMEAKLGPGARTTGLFDRTNPAFQGPPSPQHQLDLTPALPQETPPPALPSPQEEPLALTPFKPEIWHGTIDGVDYYTRQKRNKRGEVADIVWLRDPPLATLTDRQMIMPWLNGAQVRLHFHSAFIPFELVVRDYLNVLPEGPVKDIARATLIEYLAL
jgi:Rha family phage regulatory protein